MKIKKQARVKLLSRPQAEKAVQRYIEAIRKIRGFKEMNIQTTIIVEQGPTATQAVRVNAQYS
jgi:hypothetical protein